MTTARACRLEEDGQSRKDQVLTTLNSGLLKSLKSKFQVRLYRLGDHLERIESPDKLNASSPATHIGEGLKEVLADSATLPIGAVVLLSDGADNSGGIDLDTISDIKRQRIPIHTVGFGRERMAHDIEMTDVQLPARSLAKSRLQAQVTFHQWGLKGDKARLVVRDAGKILTSRDIVLQGDGARADRDGAVQRRRGRGEEPAILHRRLARGREQEQQCVDARAVRGQRHAENSVHGRRAALGLQVHPARGGRRQEHLALHHCAHHAEQDLRPGAQRCADGELKDGFPTKVEDLFDFQGMILGSVEANYFTPAQQDLIQQFVDRRGGGLLFLGGRVSLADGGYEKPPFSDLLPVRLPDHKNTFHRDPATVELTAAGRDSLITRIEDNPDANVERWKKLPYLMNFQEAGQPKPGALVLVDMNASGHKLPLLITQNYGRGRTAVFATGGDWRWQMLQPVQDMSHEMF